MSKINDTERAEVLEGANLHYAPENEFGVIFLFAHLARKWRIKVDAIRSKFPDCIAYRKVHGRRKRLRIEFEYRSKNFKLHGHSPSKCDCLVCWEHDWQDAPPKLEIIELRREFGMGFNVWIMPTNAPYKEKLKGGASFYWSLPSQCHKGDLILFYFTLPEKCIQHIFIATDRAHKQPAGYKKGKDYMGPIRRVCSLKAPIFLEDLRNHRVLRTSHFVRCNIQGRQNATEYWPYLYDLIAKRNPQAKKTLRRFTPENLG